MSAPPQTAVPRPVPGRSIGEHGIVGNLETAALVALDGTVDYLCWPALDSPTIFAALLDPESGGAFTLSPDLPGARIVQFYVPDTNVLVTRWMHEAGSVELLDLMPFPSTLGQEPDPARRLLLRQVTVTRGEVSVFLRCAPRFDYARVTPQAQAHGDAVVFRGADLSLRLSSSLPLRAGLGEATAQVALRAGESAWFVLAGSEAPVPEEPVIAALVDDTVRAWRRWAAASTYQGRWREQVMRSALALKLLTSARHGSIAAAATFGLPEADGAGRNWDYRATWIRDASFTIYAFMRLGHVEEAEQFRHWAAQRVMGASPSDPIRIMYALDGSEAGEEHELPHLAGYAGSRPVRIGNDARRQVQLDIFGELLDSLYLSNKYGAAISHDGWRHVSGMVEYILAHWEEPDAGIWEVRDAPQHFLHSRLMCWVALDRAVRLAHKRSLPAPLVRWAEGRDQIAADIWGRFRHPEHGHFVRTRDGTDLDAALLMMPLVRFVSATDPVWLKTLDAIGATLGDDGMIFRYRTPDGLDGQEGAFTTCTFWYVECLARANRLDEARLMMEKGLCYANHVGLFAEELDCRARPLGNFPQALTHLAFISAAHFLDRKLSGRINTWQP